MGAVAIGVGILVILAFVASGSKKAEAVTYDKSLPPAPIPGSSSPEKLPETAIDSSIDKDIQEVVEQVEQKGTLGPTSLNIVAIKSPIGGVSNSQWQSYIRKSITAKQGTVSKGNNLGMFLIGSKVLEDYGFMKNVTKQSDGTWKGVWVAPYSLEKFLNDANLQYEVFEKMTKGHHKAILKRYGTVWTMVGLPPATMSGLLGVAKQAGLAGLDKWMHEDNTKRKPNTTTSYTRTNGIF